MGNKNGILQILLKMGSLNEYMNEVMNNTLPNCKIPVRWTDKWSVHWFSGTRCVIPPQQSYPNRTVRGDTNYRTL